MNTREASNIKFDRSIMLEVNQKRSDDTSTASILQSPVNRIFAKRPILGTPPSAGQLHMVQRYFLSRFQMTINKPDAKVALEYMGGATPPIRDRNDPMFAELFNVLGLAPAPAKQTTTEENPAPIQDDISATNVCPDIIANVRPVKLTTDMTAPRAFISCRRSQHSVAARSFKQIEDISATNVCPVITNVGLGLDAAAKNLLLIIKSVGRYYYGDINLQFILLFVHFAFICICSIVVENFRFFELAMTLEIWILNICLLIFVVKRNPCLVFIVHSFTRIMDFNILLG